VHALFATKIDKAYNTGKFTIIAKSNSMRSAKDKQKTLETIKKELQDKMKENCKTQFETGTAH
jgi:hypothetical protein